MEITRIEEIGSPEAIRSFYLKIVNLNDISSLPGSINIIDFDRTTMQSISALLSDSAYSQNSLPNSIDSDTKFTFIFNEKIDIVNNLIILNDVVNEKEFYVIESLNTTYSSDNPNDVVNVAIVQKLDDYVQNKKFLVFINEISESNKSENLNVKFVDNFLIQHIYKVNSEGAEIEQPFLGVNNSGVDYNSANALSIMAYPTEVDDQKMSVYFSTLSKFSALDIRDLCVAEKVPLISPEDQFDKNYQIFFYELLQVYKNQNLILSNYAGLTDEQVKKFKEKIYSGNNAEEYVNYALSALLNNSVLNHDAKKELFMMCSGFLKSIYCFAGGFTDAHKFVLPFYFDVTNEGFLLKSNFYQIAKVREVTAVVAGEKWNEQLKEFEKGKKPLWQ